MGRVLSKWIRHVSGYSPSYSEAVVRLCVLASNRQRPGVGSLFACGVRPSALPMQHSIALLHAYILLLGRSISHFYDGFLS